MLHAILLWRLEKGIDCLSVAYLNRGLTLGSAYTAPLKIRCVHWLPAVLVVLWAFSPVGSQSSLRFIVLERGVVSSQLADALRYVYPLATYDSACASCYRGGAHNAVFLSFFLSTNYYQHAAQDSWGNIKIPLLNSTSTPKSTDEWTQTPWKPGMQYCGLAGIPFSRSQDAGNITFRMDSWYWELQNATLWQPGSRAPLLEAGPGSDRPSALTNHTSAGRQWQFAIPENWNASTSSTIPVSFELTQSGTPIQNSPNKTYSYGVDDNSDDSLAATRLDGIIVQRPVELNVSCTPSACNVTALRYTAFDSSYNVSLDMEYFKLWYLPHLTAAFPVEHTGTPFYGVLEAYLKDPTQNPYDLLNGYFDLSNLTQLDARTMAQRLSQVLNTYWMVDNQFTSATGGSSARVLLNNNNNAPNEPFTDIKNSTVTSLANQDFLHRNDHWFALLCVSTLVMALASMASVILTLVRAGPDATDFLSALTLGSGSNFPDCGSHLDGDDRVKVLKDTKLMIGDVKPDHVVGQVGIGLHGDLGMLRKGRLYR